MPRMNKLFSGFPSPSVLNWNDYVFIIFLGLLFVFIILWIICKALGYLLTFFGNRFLAEGKAVDQGEKLNAVLKQLEVDLSALFEEFRSTLSQQLIELSDQSAKKIIQSLGLSRDYLIKTILPQMNPSQVAKVLESEERKVAALLSQAQRSLLANLEKSDLSHVGQRLLNEKIQKIIQSAEFEYVLFIKEENLGFEPEDSFAAKLSKIVRRLIRWSERRLRWLMQPIQFGSHIKLVKVRSVPFRQILETRLGNEFLVKFEQALLDQKKIPLKLKALFLEASRVIRFNFETASASLFEKKEGEKSNPTQIAAETAQGALERAAARIETIIPEREESQKALSAVIQEESDKALGRIRRDCDLADTLGEVITRLIDQVKKRITAQMDPTKKRIRIGVLYGQKIWKGAHEKFTKARTKLGLEVQQADELVGLLDHATVQHAQAQVPALYRRVFRFEPLSDEEFFVGRGQEISKFEAAIDRWKKGFPSSIAIHGPSGSGKTSLVQCALHRFFQDDRIFYRDLKQSILTPEDLRIFLMDTLGLKDLKGNKTDIVGLAELAKSQIGKGVIIIEGIHQLFQRTIGGFEVIHEFLRFMNHTRSQFLWVVSASELGWSYLNYTKNISKYFVFEIPAQNMSRVSLEKVMMVRHEITGYELSFDTHEGLPRDLAWKMKRNKDKKDLQEIVREAFFDRLHELTEGNIFSAIYYWLSSTKFEGDQKVVVKFPEPLLPDLIRSLSRSQIATLLAVCQQGSLRPELHSRIFRSKIFVSEGILTELERKNILLFEDLKGYSPNPIVIPSVIQVLKERNLVYS